MLNLNSSTDCEQLRMIGLVIWAVVEPMPVVKVYIHILISVETRLQGVITVESLKIACLESCH